MDVDNTQVRDPLDQTPPAPVATEENTEVVAFVQDTDAADQPVD